jgi:hypothetical protein
MRTSGVISGSWSYREPDWTLDRDPKLNQKASYVGMTCAFVNAYNVNAFAAGQPQYVLSQRLKEDGYMDFMSAADVTSEDTLYLYASKLKGQVQATKDVKDATTGGEPASTGKYGVNFAQGSAELNDAGKAEVANAAEFVAAYEEKYGYLPNSSYAVYGGLAMQVIMKAIAASDGTRQGVLDAVFAGEKLCIDKAESVSGTGFCLDQATGDVDTIVMTLQQMQGGTETDIRPLETS